MRHPLRAHHRASTPPLHQRYRSQLLVGAALVAALLLFSGFWLQPDPAVPTRDAPSSAIEADYDFTTVE